MKVIIDTNGLMTQAQWGIDIFDELSALGYDEFIVPSSVKQEIEKLKTKVKGNDRAALVVAQALLKRCRVVESTGYADDAVIATAKALDAPVFTNDAGLRARLKREGIRSIFLRSRQKLVIE